MLPGKMNQGNTINNRAAHDNANLSIIQAAIKEIRNPLPATATGKAGPE